MRDIFVPALQETSPAFPPRPPLRTLLKDATAADHAKLDAQLGGLDLISRPGYRRFLEINAAALVPLEQGLLAAGVRDVLPAWDVHARTGAILDDLAKVGGRLRPLPAFVAPDRFAILGTLYVLEGSRLGSSYLLKTVRSTRDPIVADATAYLRHGAGQRLWTTFLTLLESHANELADESELVRPARRAFNLFATAAAQP